MTSVPDSADASTTVGSFSSAMIEAYSVPCAPASRASTGPGLAPLTTITGIDSAASLPAATSMAPTAICPGAAVAVPTVNGACAAATVALPQNASVTSQPLSPRVSTSWAPPRCCKEAAIARTIAGQPPEP